MKKVAKTAKKVQYVTSQRKRDVPKATVTINRIGTIRSIFTIEQREREHLTSAAGVTQYDFGVEG